MIYIRGAEVHVLETKLKTKMASSDGMNVNLPYLPDHSLKGDL